MTAKHPGCRRTSVPRQPGYCGLGGSGPEHFGSEGIQLGLQTGALVAVAGLQIGGGWHRRSRSTAVPRPEWSSGRRSRAGWDCSPGVSQVAPSMVSAAMPWSSRGARFPSPWRR